MIIKQKIALVLIGLGVVVSAVGYYPVAFPSHAVVSAPKSASPVGLPSFFDIKPTPTASTSPVPVEVPTVTSSPVFREVDVELQGGMSVVDSGRGPVLFPLPDGFPPYVVEHDLYGGWQRFGDLQEGMSVKMTGLVTGTYTVGQVINIPNGATTEELKTFKTKPKVMLQTCITGTGRMIVVGLY